MNCNAIALVRVQDNDMTGVPRRALSC